MLVHNAVKTLLSLTKLNILQKYYLTFTCCLLKQGFKSLWNFSFTDQQVDNYVTYESYVFQELLSSQ